MLAPAPYRPWLHRFAVLTAAAVFPLLVLGGLVTSMRVGMADPKPVRAPWYMFTLDWQELWAEGNRGYLIEHGHRQVGWIVGVLIIVLTVWLFVAERRRWVKVLGVVALLGVGLQGVLGMARIDLNSAGYGLELAMVHGIFGPLVFALLAAIAAITTRCWMAGQAFDVEDAARFRRVTRLTLFMMVLQLVAGVFLRQIGLDLGFMPLLVHLFFALAVIAHVLMLWVRVGRWKEPPALIHRSVTILLALMAGQVLLGLGAFVYGGGAGAAHQAQASTPPSLALQVFATSHSAVGALMLASALVVALHAGRHLNGHAVEKHEPAPKLSTAGGAA